MHFEKSWTGYLVAAFGIAATTAVLKLFSSHVNATTVALALLVVVLLVATWYGARPAVWPHCSAFCASTTSFYRP